MADEPGNRFRKIIHVDMDAFYASVEQRDNPAHKGRPLVVGGSPIGRGGVIAAASYEARKYGIRSAMPSKRAQQLCPDVIFVTPRFEVYKQISWQIHAILHRYTDLIEPLSLDEAFLDVTHDKLNIGSAIQVANEIRQAIRKELNLTASAGVSVNKFVAKIASDMGKPDGMTFVGPSRIQRFMEQLPVEKFFGVGRVTAEKMKRMGLFTGADLKRLDKKELIAHFGKPGNFFYDIVRGIDNREVHPQREIKSVSAEDTFPSDLEHQDELETEIDRIACVVSDRLKRRGLKGRTVTLKIKYHDFKLVTRRRSVADPLDESGPIACISKQLLNATELKDKRIRLLGIGVSNFSEGEVSPSGNNERDQLKLF